MDKNTRLDYLSDQEIVDEISSRFELLVNAINNNDKSCFYSEKEIFDLLAKHKKLAQELSDKNK